MIQSPKSPCTGEGNDTERITSFWKKTNLACNFTEKCGRRMNTRMKGAMED